MLVLLYYLEIFQCPERKDKENRRKKEENQHIWIDFKLIYRATWKPSVTCHNEKWSIIHSCSNHSNLKMEAECLMKTWKMVETSCKKYWNKEQLQNILTIFISFRKLIKTPNLPATFHCDFQYLLCFHSIREAPSGMKWSFWF